jgi:hypothetical protein
MIEEWRKVKEYDDLYLVSNTGKIKRNGKILKEHKDTNGYRSIALSKKGIVKHYRIHRLVAQQFLPNRGNKPQINHKDGNPQNNYADNLEWVTSQENIKHSFGVLEREPTRAMLNKFGDQHNRSKSFFLISPEGIKKRYGSMLEAKRILGVDNSSICYGLKTRDPYIFKRGKLKGYTVTLQ